MQMIIIYFPFKSRSGTIYDGNYTYIITEATKESPVLHRFTRLTSIERPRHERSELKKNILLLIMKIIFNDLSIVILQCNKHDFPSTF